MRQLELFQEEYVPPILPDPVCFSLTLGDGTILNADFEYITPTMPHYSFYGDISETGYQSYFPFRGELKQEDIEPLAKEAAELFRAKFLREQEKGKRFVCS